MAWNESGNGKNPWDRGRREGPPDLERLLRDWQRKLNAFLRGGRGGGSPLGGAAPGPLPWVLLALLVVAWALTGFYRVDDAERGVVLREGATLDEPTLRDFCGQRLAAFKVPRKIVFLAEIPKGATGKLQRIGLAEKLGLSG